jgi:tetratricopeptide (TPR) repeat protein
MVADPAPPGKRGPEGAARARRRAVATAVLAALLLAGVLAAFAPVARNGFTIYDDSDYLTGNPVVRRGLTAEGVRWAFTATRFNNWHPVTWLSHMADVSLFGMDAGRHHLVGVLIHAASTLLLFLLLARATGRPLLGAATAALFALHPLRVESVAWAAERKDVLSVFLGFCALAAYDGHVRRPAARRLAAVTGLFALALMAKPMLVTLPFLLLLLDYWPYGRWPRAGRGATAAPPTGLARLVGEKAPLLLLAAGAGLVTYRVQALGGAGDFGARFPFPLKAANAAVAAVKYLGMAAYPRGLAVLYPFPERYPGAGTLAAALLALAGATLLAVRFRRSHPYLVVGWLWYLGTLVPVIGFVQIGLQGMADRYTYLPLVGIFLLVSWSLGSLAARRPALRAPVAALALGALAVCIPLTRAQVRVWRDDVTLFAAAVARTSGNWVAENNLGNVLSVAGRAAEAIPHYRAALAASPGNAESHYNLAHNLETLGRTEEAAEHYRAAIAADPGFAGAHNNLGLLLRRQGRTEEALEHLRAAVRLDPTLGYARWVVESAERRGGTEGGR